MKTMIASLLLSRKLDGRTRERCPDVVFTIDGVDVAVIRTDVEEPRLLLPDGKVDATELHDDALSRVMDEPAWLVEIARVTAPGGLLAFTLPASGPLAWLDMLNMYRYVADISKRGDPPDASLPTGWNRHYSRENIVRLLQQAGFDDVRIEATCYADREIALFATLMRKNWIAGSRTAELESFPRLGRHTPGKRRFPLATTWSVTARKRR